MHMNSSMSHNRATNPHCGSGDSLSYTSNKSKLPVNTITVSSSVNKLNPTPCQIQRGSVNLRVCCVNACACNWVCVCVVVGIRGCLCVCVCAGSVCESLMRVLRQCSLGSVQSIQYCYNIIFCGSGKVSTH